MLRAHGLEKAVATVVICHETHALQDQELQTVAIAKIKKLPLGPLMKRFIEAAKPSEDIHAALEKVLYIRNDLAHRISDMILDAMVEPAWTPRVTVDLEVACTAFAECRELLLPYVRRAEELLGVTEAHIAEVIRTSYQAVDDV
jgi:hypothetical protein